jgi:hypothetical protein
MSPLPTNDAASQQDLLTGDGHRLRRRIYRYRIASGDGPIDRIKIGCAFGVLKAANWVDALVQERRGHLATTCIVSDKYRFVFCGIPKVGTRSFREALASPEIAAFRVARGRTALLAADGDSPYQFHYKFSFVRNPWSRTVSCYRDKVQILQPTTIGKLSIIAKHPGLCPGLPFDAFVEWLCSPEGSDRFADLHWMSQYKFITTDAGRIICDFVGRLESIEADLKTVCDAVGLPAIKLAHYHRSNYEDMCSYRDYYNDLTRKLIEQRYECDVEMFKYVF